MFFSSLLPYSTTSRPTTRTTFRAVTQDNLRVPITVHFVFTASFLHVSFLFHLSSRALKQCLPSPRHFHAAFVRSLIYLFLVFPFYAYIFYSITITGTPEVAVTIFNLDTADRQSTHVYKIVLLLVEEGIEPNRQVFPLLSFSSLLTCVFPLPSATTHGTAVRAILVDLSFRLISSRHSLSFLLFISFHLPLLLGRLFHPRSTYPRYIGTETLGQKGRVVVTYLRAN